VVRLSKVNLRGWRFLLCVCDPDRICERKSKDSRERRVSKQSSG